MWSEVVFLWTFSCIVFSQFFDCQNDPTSDPEEGPADELQFTWLGVLQYIHIQRGNPHFFRVPRVVVITRQFALSTAVDAAQVPGGYALGNIVLGEYERDEEECGVTVEDVAAGARCDPAMMLVPIADVLLHPEYKNFGAQNSVALLKLITQIKSRYMLPACLPFKDFVMDADGTPTMVQFYHIDYTTAVPRDLYNEEKEVTLISLLPREVCYLYDTPDNSTKFVIKRMACTTGCDFYSGAPSVVHETTGHWTLVALSEGSAPCPDPLVPRAPPPPPRHLLLHQYVPWITAAISGTPVGSFVRDDPFGYMVARTSSKYDRTRFGWVGHWWMGGIRCYDRGAMADDIFRFYHEVFQVNPRVQTNLTYYLEIDSAYDSVVVCVKLGMPNAIGQPRVWGLHTSNVKVRIPVIRLKKKYKFEVEAWAHGRKHEEGRRAGEEDEASDEAINVEETNNTRPLV